jgi:radical SAM superfamily enzyme YgiQ (UPF0313 family)
VIETIGVGDGIQRVNFVEPGAPDLHIWSHFRLPRMGTVLLATILRHAGYRTRCFCEDVRPVSVSELADADLVCISTVTTTAPRAYGLADQLRRRGVRVILGGPHVTFMVGEAMEHCDWAFRGEADEWVTQAVAAIDGRFDPAEVRGLSWRDAGGQVHHNPRSDFVRDLDALPPPDFSLLGTGYSRAWTRRIIPLMTSRGCPYDCSFCAVTPMFGRCYRFKSLERVIDELRAHDVRDQHVFFYDDHFCADPRRSHRLLDALLASDLRFQWSAQVRADVGRDEGLVAKMARAGCYAVYVGMESVNPQTLVSFNKRQTVADMERNIRVFRRHRIHIHGMFVLGADTDTVATVRQTAEFALDNRINSAQFTVLTPLPGTRCFEALRREGRILVNDWRLYDCQHVVFRPARISGYELQREVCEATMRFYTKRQAFKQLLRLQLTNSVITLYARRHMKRWSRGNAGFMAGLRSLDTGAHGVHRRPGPPDPVARTGAAPVPKALRKRRVGAAGANGEEAWVSSGAGKPSEESTPRF